MSEPFLAWVVAIILCAGAHAASVIYARGVRRGIDLALKNMGKMNFSMDLLITHAQGTVEFRATKAGENENRTNRPARSGAGQQ